MAHHWKMFSKMFFRKGIFFHGAAVLPLVVGAAVLPGTSSTHFPSLQGAVDASTDAAAAQLREMLHTALATGTVPFAAIIPKKKGSAQTALQDYFALFSKDPQGLRQDQGPWGLCADYNNSKESPLKIGDYSAKESLENLSGENASPSETSSLLLSRGSEENVVAAKENDKVPFCFFGSDGTFRMYFAKKKALLQAKYCGDHHHHADQKFEEEFFEKADVKLSFATTLAANSAMFLKSSKPSQMKKAASFGFFFSQFMANKNTNMNDVEHEYLDAATILKKQSDDVNIRENFPNPDLKFRNSLRVLGQSAADIIADDDSTTKKIHNNIKEERRAQQLCSADESCVGYYVVSSPDKSVSSDETDDPAAKEEEYVLLYISRPVVEKKDVAASSCFGECLSSRKMNYLKLEEKSDTRPVKYERPRFYGTRRDALASLLVEKQHQREENEEDSGGPPEEPSEAPSEPVMPPMPCRPMTCNAAAESSARPMTCNAAAESSGKPMTCNSLPFAENQNDFGPSSKDLRSSAGEDASFLALAGFGNDNHHPQDGTLGARLVKVTVLQPDDMKTTQPLPEHDEEEWALVKKIPQAVEAELVRRIAHGVLDAAQVFSVAARLSQLDIKYAGWLGAAKEEPVPGVGKSEKEKLLEKLRAVSATFYRSKVRSLGATSTISSADDSTPDDDKTSDDFFSELMQVDDGVLTVVKEPSSCDDDLVGLLLANKRRDERIKKKKTLAGKDEEKKEGTAGFFEKKSTKLDRVEEEPEELDRVEEDPEETGGEPEEPEEIEEEPEEPELVQAATVLRSFILEQLEQFPNLLSTFTAGRTRHSLLHHAAVAREVELVKTLRQNHGATPNYRLIQSTQETIHSALTLSKSSSYKLFPNTVAGRVELHASLEAFLHTLKEKTASLFEDVSSQNYCDLLGRLELGFHQLFMTLNNSAKGEEAKPNEENPKDEANVLEHSEQSEKAAVATAVAEDEEIKDLLWPARPSFVFKLYVNKRNAQSLHGTVQIQLSNLVVDALRRLDDSSSSFADSSINSSSTSHSSSSACASGLLVADVKDVLAAALKLPSVELFDDSSNEDIFLNDALPLNATLRGRLTGYEDPPLSVFVDQWNSEKLRNLRKKKFWNPADFAKTEVYGPDPAEHVDWAPEDGLPPNTEADAVLRCHECLPRELLHQQMNSVGALPAELDSINEFADADAEANGVILTLHGMFSDGSMQTNDCLYQKHPIQTGQRVYRGRSFALVGQLAKALRALFSKSRSPDAYGADEFPHLASDLAAQAEFIEAEIFSVKTLREALQRANLLSVDLNDEQIARMRTLREENHRRRPIRRDTPFPFETWGELFLTGLEADVRRDGSFQQLVKHVVRKVKQAAQSTAIADLKVKKSLQAIGGVFKMLRTDSLGIVNAFVGNSFRGEKPAVVVNLECSSAKLGSQMCSMDDVATLMSFGLTMQFGDYSLKALIALWDHADAFRPPPAPAGPPRRFGLLAEKLPSNAKDDDLAKTNPLGENPFVRLKRETSKGVWEHLAHWDYSFYGDRNSLLLQSNLPEVPHQPCWGPPLKNEENEAELLSTLPPLFAALFANPSDSAFRCNYMRDTITFVVKPEHLAGGANSSNQPYRLQTLSAAFPGRRAAPFAPADAEAGPANENSAETNPPPEPAVATTTGNKNADADVDALTAQMDTLRINSSSRGAAARSLVFRKHKNSAAKATLAPVSPAKELIDNGSWLLRKRTDDQEPIMSTPSESLEKPLPIHELVRAEVEKKHIRLCKIGNKSHVGNLQNFPDFEIEDRYREWGREFEGSEKFAGHVALVYKYTEHLCRLGPCQAPGTLLASMVHFVDMDQFKGGSLAQVNNFHRLLNGGVGTEAFRAWQQQRGRGAAAAEPHAKPAVVPAGSAAAGSAAAATSSAAGASSSSAGAYNNANNNTTGGGTTANTNFNLARAAQSSTGMLPNMALSGYRPRSDSGVGYLDPRSNWTRPTSMM